MPLKKPAFVEYTQLGVQRTISIYTKALLTPYNQVSQCHEYKICFCIIIIIQQL